MDLRYDLQSPTQTVAMRSLMLCNSDVGRRNASRHCVCGKRYFVDPTITADTICPTHGETPKWAHRIFTSMHRLIINHINLPFPNIIALTPQITYLLPIILNIYTTSLKSIFIKFKCHDNLQDTTNILVLVNYKTNKQPNGSVPISSVDKMIFFQHIIAVNFPATLSKCLVRRPSDKQQLLGIDLSKISL